MKRNKLVYWISTGLLSAGFGASAIMYLTANPAITEGLGKAGYPAFMVPLLGVAKLLAVIGLLNPWFGRIKEWAYAGTVFVLVGAVWTHVATSTSFVAPLVFLLITAISYYYRGKTQATETKN